MPVHTAKVIDLEERRRERQRQDMMRVEDSALLAPPMLAMTWVPFWFVPVFFAGSGSNFG